MYLIRFLRKAVNGFLYNIYPTPAPFSMIRLYPLYNEMSRQQPLNIIIIIILEKHPKSGALAMPLLVLG